MVKSLLQTGHLSVKGRSFVSLLGNLQTGHSHFTWRIIKPPALRRISFHFAELIAIRPDRVSATRSASLFVLGLQRFSSILAYPVSLPQRDYRSDTAGVNLCAISNSSHTSIHRTAEIRTKIVFIDKLSVLVARHFNRIHNERCRDLAVSAEQALEGKVPIPEPEPYFQR